MGESWLNGKHLFPHNTARSKMLCSLREFGCSASSSILEIGCGAGQTTKFIAEASNAIIGVDVSQESLRRYCQQGWIGIQADSHYLPFKNEVFDYVLFSMVLHHLIKVGNITKCMEEARRVVKPKGYVLAEEPSILYPSGILMNIFNSLKPGIIGLDAGERSVMPSKLIRIFKNVGLTQVNCVAASYSWNRLPLRLSNLIARHEDSVRSRMPFNMFGWFVIISGRKD